MWSADDVKFNSGWNVSAISNHFPRLILFALYTSLRFMLLYNCCTYYDTMLIWILHYCLLCVLFCRLWLRKEESFWKQWLLILNSLSLQQWILVVIMARRSYLLHFVIGLRRYGFLLLGSWMSSGVLRWQGMVSTCFTIAPNFIVIFHGFYKHIFLQDFQPWRYTSGGSNAKFLGGMFPCFMNKICSFRDVLLLLSVFIVYH